MITGQRWAKVPAWLVASPDITDAEIRLWCAVAARDGARGCIASNATIAADCAKGVAVVRRHLAALVAKGALSRSFDANTGARTLRAYVTPRAVSAQGARSGSTPRGEVADPPRGERAHNRQDEQIVPPNPPSGGIQAIRFTNRDRAAVAKACQGVDGTGGGGLRSALHALKARGRTDADLLAAAAWMQANPGLSLPARLDPINGKETDG